MCEFISWIEFQGSVYFLDDTKLRAEKGQKLLSQCTNDDIIGHGAIMEYFGLTRHQGIHKECTYFSDPKNFPEEIVEAIKMGLFRNFGICQAILTQSAQEKYNKIEQPAWENFTSELLQVPDSISESFASTVNCLPKGGFQIYWQPDIFFELWERSATCKPMQLIWEKSTEKIESVRKTYNKIISNTFWDLVIESENRIDNWK